MQVTIQKIIELKKDGRELSREHINMWIDKLISDQVAPVQLGAFLMAVRLNGLSQDEIIHLTRAMKESGQQMEWPDHWDTNLVVDKHSTGGVGDKISLPLAPALAACGLKIPMVSGRGLGFTGGTIDKLESISNFRSMLTQEEITSILEDVGCVIVAQTKQICPADRLMYQARDVTGTVDSEGLIISSIICKKVSENIKHLVLDVKWGNGSYNGDLEQATALAESLRSVSEGLGVNTSCIISSMDHPIGCAIGNSLEVLESIQCLRGGGSADLRKMVCALGGVLLASTGLVKTREQGELQIGAVLDDGSALQRFGRMLVRQGVDEKTVGKLISEDNSGVLPASDRITQLVVERSGYVQQIHAGNLARFSGGLGAGRKNPKDQIKFGAGIWLLKTPGDWVETGEAWAEVHHDEPLSQDTLDEVRSYISLVENKPVIRERISSVLS